MKFGSKGRASDLIPSGKTTGTKTLDMFERQQLGEQLKMFTKNKMNKVVKNYKDSVSPDINVFTCTIGRRATQAKYFIGDPGQIVTILEQLNNKQHRVKMVEQKKKVAGMKSLANFGNLQFGKLVDTSHDKDSIVKTKNAGIFMRHNKVNQGLKNRLG
jgi:hypothetical protein